MGSVIELPGGYTATLRDPKQLRERHRRLIQTSIVPLVQIYARVPPELAEAAAKGDKDAQQAAEVAISSLIKNREEAANMAAMKDAVIVALLQSWTVPQPLPDILTVQDLDGELYDALEKGTRHFTGDLIAATSPTSFEVKPDIEEEKEAPFGESGNSNASSKQTGKEARSTRRQHHAGAATATEASTPA